jgi:hypothetical protein
MSRLRESVVLAVLATILISIPAASQRVDITEGENFGGTIDSKFSNMFELDFESGNMLMEMINSESRLEINETFDRKTKSLQTPSGYLKKTKTNNSIVKVVQTPYGRFKWGFREGNNFSDFEGGNKDKAQEIKRSLMNEMEEKIREAKEKKQVVISRILPNIEIQVETRNEVEHFNLTNRGDKEVDLENWKIVTDGGEGDTMTLGKIIEPGEELTYYSNEMEDVERSENIFLNTGLTIYSGEGQITLYNEHERVVESVSY